QFSVKADSLLHPKLAGDPGTGTTERKATAKTKRSAVADRFIRGAKRGLCVEADGLLRFDGLLFGLGAGGLVALRAELHEGSGFDVEAWNIAVDDGLPDHAGRGLGAEVVLVVEAMHLLHDVLGGQARVFDVRHLMAAAVFHLFVGDEVVALGEVVELGAGVGVRYGDLDGFAVKRLGEVDGVADGLLGFAGEAEDEVGVDNQAEVVAVLDELTRALDGGALLDVLEDLRVAGLEADDEQTAAGFLHGLEGVAVGGRARGAGPGDAERLEFGTELDGAVLLDVEGVIVEEEFLDVREVLLGPLKLGSDVVGGALAPGVTGEGLRPEAEGALRGAAAGGVERDVGVQKERDVVLRDVHVALVDLGGPGHRVEIFDLRAVGVVLDGAGRVFVADAEDFVQRLAVGELDDGEVELAAAYEVDDFTLVESAIGVGGDWRPDEADLDGGVRGLDGASKTVVAGPADGGGEEHQELVALGDLDGLVGGDVVGRGVEQPRTLQHAGGIGEPDGVPVGLDLAGRGPAGAGAAVEVLERGRIQEQGFKRHTINLILPFRYGEKARNDAGVERKIPLARRIRKTMTTTSYGVGRGTAEGDAAAVRSHVSRLPCARISCTCACWRSKRELSIETYLPRSSISALAWSLGV